MGNGLVNTKGIEVRDIKIYPTVTDDFITIDISEVALKAASKVLIYNMSGINVGQFALTNEILEVKSLNPGVYIGVLLEGANSYQFKFVKR